MANETYNILQGIFNGKTPIQRSEPMSGQSEYYYMKPNQNSYTPLSQMQTVDVPSATTPNPYLWEKNSNSYSKNSFGDYFAENILDTFYGVNRAVNGLTFGGLDKLGKRYGFDSSMSDYANLRGGNIRHLGEIAQVGGNMLPSVFPLSAGLDKYVKWNGHKKLIKQLHNGGDFTDINMGKIDGNLLDRVKLIRKQGNLPKLGQQGYIPAKVVKKFYEKRLEQDFTPEGLSRLFKRVFEDRNNIVSQSKHKHIQEIKHPRGNVSDVGYISMNPANGKTVIKSIYKK